jgi:ADP-heptose:LPS heptosyltransferase
MNVARMRALDRWLGLPVCCLLTLFRRMFDRRSLQADKPVRRILFVKLAEQGSTVLAQGALRAAIDRVGRENVFFLLFAENRPILDLLDLIPAENVVAIPARGLFGAVRGAVGAVWQMWRARIDAAIDLEFFARSSAALGYLSGARWRVGYHAHGGEASYRGDLMTHRLNFNPYLHTSQAFQVMVEALDQPPEQFPLLPIHPPAAAHPVRFEPTEQERAEMRGLLDELLGDARDSRLILLNANASDLLPLRRWPGERYAELAGQLLALDPRTRLTPPSGRRSTWWCCSARTRPTSSPPSRRGAMPCGPAWPAARASTPSTTKLPPAGTTWA